MIDFTEEQIERYSRHILLQDVGVEGQEKILNAKVLIIGAGGLGEHLLLCIWLRQGSVRWVLWTEM